MDARARTRSLTGFQRLRPALPVIVIGALLALLPTSTCIVRIAFGVPCPACGLTRGALALAHLDFAGAQHVHPLSIALAAITIAMTSFAFVASDRAWARTVNVVTGAVGVALVIVWALRFAGLFGGPVAG